MTRQSLLFDEPRPRRRVLVADDVDLSPLTADELGQLQSLLWMGDRWSARAKGVRDFVDDQNPVAAVRRALQAKRKP